MPPNRTLATMNNWIRALLITILTSTSFSSNCLKAQVWDWTTIAGSGGTIRGEGVAIDVWGNLYSIGNYYGGAIFFLRNYMGIPFFSKNLSSIGCLTAESNSLKVSNMAQKEGA